MLFVSEKMAALEVVYRRLSQCGLDSLCLELHNHKAKKKAVIDQLAEALEDSSPGQLEPNALITLAQLSNRRATLNGYVRALHDSDTKLGVSVFRAHGEVAHRGSIPDLPFALPNIDAVDPSQLVKWFDFVGRLKTIGHVVLSQNTHLWRGCKLIEYSLQIQAEIQSRFGKLKDDLQAAATEGAMLAVAMGLEQPRTVRELQRLEHILDFMTRNPLPPSDWFTSPTLSPVLESARAHAQEAKEYHRRRDSILAIYTEGILAGSTSEFLQRLTDGAVPLSTASPCPRGS